MSFPRYPKYKPSGVEWLGEVPEGWETIHLRRLVTEHRQGYYTTDPYVQSGVKLLRITDLGESGEVNYDTCPRVEDRSDVKEFILRNGDFVFARTGGAGSFGLIGEISERVVYASYLIRFRFVSHALSRFMRFFFLSAGFKGGIQRNIHGGVNQNVHAQDIKNQCFTLPPSGEQTAIAEFLDRETGKIDELVAEQRRLMELLKEKRQAVISHAVTKGLNPHAPLKPSGIEWLGDVPEHWDMTRVGFVASVARGTGYQNVTEIDEDDNAIRMIRISDFNDFDPIWVRNSETLNPYIVESTDLLIAGTGASAGITMKITDDMVGMIHSYNAPRIRCVDVDPQFLFFVLDDVAQDSVFRHREPTYLEMAVRPVNEFFILDLQAKGTVANRELMTRSFYQPLGEVDLSKFRELIDAWALTYAELYAANR